MEATVSAWAHLQREHTQAHTTAGKKWREKVREKQIWRWLVQETASSVAGVISPCAVT